MPIIVLAVAILGAVMTCRVLCGYVKCCVGMGSAAVAPELLCTEPEEVAAEANELQVKTQKDCGAAKAQVHRQKIAVSRSNCSTSFG